MPDREQLQSLLGRVFGGRPMRFICLCFIDVASRRSVSMWRDRIGRLWLATGPWSLFRVAPLHGPEIWQRPILISESKPKQETQSTEEGT